MTTPDLNRLALRWRRAPRRWGHPLHSMCSYFAMFPPQVAHVFIRWLTDEGDVVYDPFAGRGTVPLEACRMGRTGRGADANPLAYVLTAAKVNPPTLGAVHRRLDELRRQCVPENAGPHADAPDSIRMLYAPSVLSQLVWLRESLNLRRREDIFVMALLLGLLHANYTPGRRVRGLSISMPNTFAMSPNYVRRWATEKRLEPPQVDVFDLLMAKVDRMALPDRTATRGDAWLQDAQAPVPLVMRAEPAKLIFTSPPYLRVIKYGKYNWVRLWMLKHDPKLVDRALVATSSLERYLAFIQTVLNRLAQGIRDDGYLCLMVGDVREPGPGTTTNLAERVWEEGAAPLGWRLRAVIHDRLPTHAKVSRIWKQGRGQATSTDRVLVLSPRSSRLTMLPVLRPIRWGSATTWH